MIIISHVVALSNNNVIGKDNDLPWNLKTDLKHFKDLTHGHCIIMGRKTFESLPKALPNRKNIVLSTRKNITYNDAIVVNSIEKALELVTGRLLMKYTDPFHHFWRCKVGTMPCWLSM